MECSQFSYNLLPNQRRYRRRRRRYSPETSKLVERRAGHSGAIVTPIDPICSYTRVQAQLPSAKDHVIRGSRRRYAGRVKTRAKMYGFRARMTIRERADCHEIRYCRRRRRRRRQVRRKRGNDCRSCTREIVLAMAWRACTEPRRGAPTATADRDFEGARG